VKGPRGKGVAAAGLGLTHFVDDTWDVIESVFSDPVGNSGDLVRQFGGILFHFAQCGYGQRPRPCRRVADDFEKYYCGVTGWSEVIHRLKHDFGENLASDSYSVARNLVEVANSPATAPLACHNVSGQSKRLCRNFLKGTCRLGSQCEFKHL